MLARRVQPMNPIRQRLGSSAESLRPAARLRETPGPHHQGTYRRVLFRTFVCASARPKCAVL